MEMIMRASNSPTSNMVNENKSSQILEYSDDIDVIGRTKLYVDSIFLEIEKVASSYGLMVNGDKAKIEELRKP
uniref:Reverse transcriptase domain-containing protein n=1 Tax=Megaselia scalaris TaxID=36166 RepID=T1GAB3_MEGSC